MMKRDRGGRREETHVLVPRSTPISIRVKPRRQRLSTAVPICPDRKGPRDEEMLDVTFDSRRRGKNRKGAFCVMKVCSENKRNIYSQSNFEGTFKETLIKMLQRGMSACCLNRETKVRSSTVFVFFFNSQS